MYNGQNSADEVEQIAMTQSSVCHPIGTDLGLRAMITPRCERHNRVITNLVTIDESGRV